MDVIFDTQQGPPFSIEIGYFDTVLEIKEKVEKYREIPVDRQTLILNGKVLEDEADVEKADIYHNSRINLLVAPDPANPKIKTEDMSPVSKKTQLLLKLPASKKQPSVEMESSDTVQKLMDKIHEIEGPRVDQLVLHANGNTELQDQRNLHDYQLTDGSEIDVTVRPSPTASGTTAPPATGSKKLRVFVLSKCRTKRIMVEVSPSEKVQVLKKVLEKLQQRYSFELPAEGYFFIHKQNVMEENESFQCHSVRQGDIIEIFNGRVTSGP